MIILKFLLNCILSIVLAPLLIVIRLLTWVIVDTKAGRTILCSVLGFFAIGGWLGGVLNIWIALLILFVDGILCFSGLAEVLEELSCSLLEYFTGLNIWR